jgi:hypothetical protein
VPCSDWPVPLRVDHGFPPLDLKEIGWFRSEDNRSVSDLSRSLDLDPTVTGRGREKGLPPRVPVNSSGDVAAQVLNAGVVPRDGDGDGYADDVRRWTASSYAWSASTTAS